MTSYAYVYELDGAGNRTRKHWANQNIDITYNYDDLGTGDYTSRIEEIDDLYGSSSAYLTLDDAGMMEDYGGITYIWDQAGRLEELKDGSTTIAEYEYDPQNQRFKKVEGGNTTYYVYAGGRLLGEYNATGGLIREYVYFNGRPLAQIDEDTNEEITYFHVDHLGTPRVGTDDTGASVWSWSFLGNAFGDIAPSSSSTVTVNLRMAGQYYDDESGLFYNWNRYYDPATGRYVSSDPIGLAGGLNTFAYAGANPALYIDPEGLFLETIWDAANVAWDIWYGQWEDAFYDTCAMVIPFVPAGATKLDDVGEAGWDIYKNHKKLPKSLPGEKYLDPKDIKFSQDSIKSKFRDGRSMDELVEGLKNGTIDPSDVPPIRVIEKNGELISIDNRRLAAFKEAGVPIKTRLATQKEIEQAIKDKKFSAGPSGGSSVKVRRGKDD